MKWFMKYHTGYSGEDGRSLVELPDGFTQDQVNEEAFWNAVEHAAMYGHYMCEDTCEDPECDQEHPGNTNIEGYAEPYDSEKHDMYLY